jgi:hypothetical protein
MCLVILAWLLLLCLLSSELGWFACISVFWVVGRLVLGGR